MKPKIWILLLLLLSNSALLFSQHYRIGDVITNSDGSQGVVFHVNADGRGGWMVALNDVPSSCPWGTEDDIPNLNNFGQNATNPLLTELDGKENTRIIREAQHNSTEYAAGKVDFDNGWYLPSIGQLRILYSKLPLIESVLLANGGSSLRNKDYWSSTEHNASLAKTIGKTAATTTLPSGQGGNYTTTKKTYDLAVRAIRDITFYEWFDGSTADSIVVAPSETTTYEIFSGGVCDFSGSVTVTVNQSETVIIDTTVCGNFTWHGINYTESGIYTYEIEDGSDCPNTEELHLTIVGIPSVTIIAPDEVVCEGEAIDLYALVDQAAIGDILCTDGTFVRPDDWTSDNGKTAKGIIFYVDQTGSHGWALGFEEWTNVKWNKTATLVPGLTNRSTAREAIQDLDGLGNTLAIRDGSNATQFPAAFKMDITQGWYLPAMGQLRYLYSHIYTINSSLEKLGKTQIRDNVKWFYWTSTQKSAQEKWELGFKGNVRLNDGTLSSSTDGGSSAQTNIKVRAVCSF